MIGGPKTFLIFAVCLIYGFSLFSLDDMTILSQERKYFLQIDFNNFIHRTYFWVIFTNLKKISNFSEG